MDKDTENTVIELRKQLQMIQTENQQLKEENENLKNAQSNTKQSHSEDFWLNVKGSCRSNPDHVKSLVANKTITMTDTNKQSETLLILSTICGSYELVQLCVNLDADILHTDNANKTALQYSIDGAYPHIEQLLLFHLMNASVGNRLKETSQTMNKQKGISENIIKQLSSYGATTATFFKDTLIDIMINIMHQKLAFSDDLLNLCYLFTVNDNKKKNFLQSSLWKCITKTCASIIQSDNKRDWFWFKTFLLPSTIWFQKDNAVKEDDDGTYLYYELLKLVEVQSMHQLTKLEQDLTALSNKSDWNKLISWRIAAEYEDIRQDSIPNGMRSKYSFNELTKYMGVSATFNAHKFYDYHEYLPQLILLAQIIDDEFQKTVQKIFNVDKDTNIGAIDDDHKHNSDIIYVQGPVKLFKRAQTKAENDYSSKDVKFPTSACILDLNRCSLIFHDIATLLKALQLFTNKVKYYQSGNIIGIVRTKNSFQEYVKLPQYADIKLNVLIKGKTNNIIGEVQFLLLRMKQFKDKAHNLYAIQRQKEYVQNTVSLILPNLLDEDRQLFVAANMGDVRALCGLMAINNKTEQDIMKVDEKSQESILMPVIGLGHDAAYKFLKSICDKDLWVKLLFLSNKFNFNVMEGAIAFTRDNLIRDIFSVNLVKEQYKESKDHEFRVLWWLFAYSDAEIINFVLSELQISNQDVIKYLEYKYTANSVGQHQYHHLTIMTGIPQRNKSIESFKMLVSIIGETLLLKYLFVPDGYNRNALEYFIRNNRLEMMKYVMTMNEIKNECLRNKKQLFRMLYWMNHQCDKQMYDFMVDVLKNLDVSTIKQVQSYSYPESKHQAFDESATTYFDHKITDEMMNKLLDSMK